MIFGIVKTGIGLITSMGVGTIVGNAIKATTPANIKKLEKILIFVGGSVLTAVASNMASDYVEEALDKTADTTKKIFTDSEEVEEETVEEA